MPFLGKSVPIRGVEREIKAIVAGTRRKDVYNGRSKNHLDQSRFAFNVKLRESWDKTVDIGREMKVNKIEK